MAKSRRERCPYCGFLDTIKWGKQSGHQRYKCKNCGSLFTARRKDVSHKNRFVWFRWWVEGKQTVEQISELSTALTSENGFIGRPFTNCFLHHYPVPYRTAKSRFRQISDRTVHPPNYKVTFPTNIDPHSSAPRLLRTESVEWLTKQSRHPPRPSPFSLRCG